FGLSVREVASRFSLDARTVTRGLGLLELPAEVQLRLDLPLGDPNRLAAYAAYEALRVPAEAEGGQLRVAALAAAEEAGNPAAARSRVESGFLRPVRERADWEQFVESE